MNGPSEEKEDVVIFYCMVNGCGHEWEIEYKNSKKKKVVD
jgi:hypothetical protein